MIFFDGIPNARDLGGLPLSGGRRVRGGLLLRTALLSYATDRDMAILSGHYGIRKVIDLRSSHEIGKTPDKPVPGSEYVNVEIISLNGHIYKNMSKCFDEAPSFEEGMATFVMGMAAKMLCDGFYTSFISDPESQESIGKFFREVLSAEGRPILWHCTQGKDRTGLTAAFLLRVLGASMDTIMADFKLSNDFYADDMARIKALVSERGGVEEDRKCVDTLVGVSVESFEEAMAYIDSHYGGIDSYIRNQLRVSEADIVRLRELYSL